MLWGVKLLLVSCCKLGNSKGFAYFSRHCNCFFIISTWPLYFFIWIHWCSFLRCSSFPSLTHFCHALISFSFMFVLLRTRLWEEAEIGRDPSGFDKVGICSLHLQNDYPDFSLFSTQWHLRRWTFVFSFKTVLLVIGWLSCNEVLMHIIDNASQTQAQDVKRQLIMFSQISNFSLKSHPKNFSHFRQQQAICLSLALCSSTILFYNQIACSYSHTVTSITPC